MALATAPKASTRSVLITPFADATVDLAKSLSANSTTYAAVLFLMPDDLQTLPPSRIEELMQVEKLLLSSRLPLPVYFADDTPELRDLMAGLQQLHDEGKRADAQSGGVKMIVTGKNPPLKYELSNIVGLLRGASNTFGSGDGEEKPPDSKWPSNPTIAVVAHWGSFAMTPALAHGAGDNGSGVVVLLQLARMMKRLYAQLGSRPKFDLLFLLSAGGHLDYLGSRGFLQTSGPPLISKVDFAICLDSVGNWQNGRGLRMLYSRPSSDSFVRQWYDALEIAATSRNIPFESVHKKIRLRERFQAGEHEAWARMRVLAVTLTDSTSSKPSAFTGSAFDSIASPSDALANVSQLLFDAISSVVAPDAEHLNITPQPKFLERWRNNLASTPRMEPYVGKGSKIFTALEKALGDAVNHVHVSTATLAPEHMPVFQSVTKTKAKVVHVASLWFEVGFAATVTSWLALVYLAVTLLSRGTKGLLEDLHLYQPKGKSKVT